MTVSHRKWRQKTVLKKKIDHVKQMPPFVEWVSAANFLAGNDNNAA